MLLEPERQVELTHHQRVSWWRLIRSSNVGPVTFKRLLNRFGSADAALEALPSFNQHGGGKSDLCIPTAADAEEEFDRLNAVGGRMVALNEQDFPSWLQFVHGPPPLLSVIGSPAPDWNRCISVVGARNASAAGRKITRQISQELGANGYTIVSGLARGIDTSAHQATLKTGTIAVFAGGVDHVYPSENAELARQIVENGGALVSEMPMGSEPRARDFPRRNRLVSGISLGVLVVESALRSGSLITARLALEQNREVFAVPGSPVDPRAGGTNKLIKDGATLVTQAQDILDELSSEFLGQGQLLEPGAAHRFDDFDSDHPDQIADEPLNDDHRASLLEALSVTPTPVDELTSACRLPASTVQTILLELELAGRLERSAGQLVALV